LLQTRSTPPADRYRTKRVAPQVTYPAGVLLCLLLTIGLVAGAVYLVVALTTTDGGGKPLTDPVPPEGWLLPYLAIPFVVGALLAVPTSVLAVSVPDSWARSRSFHEWLGGLIFDCFDRFPILEVRRPEKDDLYLHGVAATSVLFAAVFFTVVAVV